jgi:hypothetical protein
MTPRLRAKGCNGIGGDTSESKLPVRGAHSTLQPDRERKSTIGWEEANAQMGRSTRLANWTRDIYFVNPGCRRMYGVLPESR